MRKARRPVAVEEVRPSSMLSENEGLWGIALMRIAVELRLRERRGLIDAVDRTADRMGLPKADLELFLRSRFGLELPPASGRAP